MSQSLKSRVKRLERLIPEKSKPSAADKAAAEARMALYARKFTPRQQAIYDAFQKWFATTFPPLIKAEISLNKDGTAARPERYFSMYGLLAPYEKKMFVSAAKADVEAFLAEQFPEERLADMESWLRSRLIEAVACRASDEIISGRVADDQRRYYLHPDEMMLVGWPPVPGEPPSRPTPTRWIVTQPTGELLERAKVFEKRWRKKYISKDRMLRRGALMVQREGTVMIGEGRRYIGRR